MHIILIRVLDITNRQAIELLQMSAAIDVNREENRPGHTKSHEAYEDNHLQEPKEQIGVKGLLLQQFMIF
jgi:hypothetical protein